jgi:alkylhydroperoxidase/carboxymuconolactone decarboxylase family protein YurZ
MARDVRHTHVNYRVAMSSEQTPVLKVLTHMTASSMNESSLGPRDLELVRLAALVAVGAPTASYLMNVGLAADRGITVDDVQGLLAGVAPIVGTARVVEASANITSALGLAVDLAGQVDV